MRPSMAAARRCRSRKLTALRAARSRALSASRNARTSGQSGPCVTCTGGRSSSANSSIEHGGELPRAKSSSCDLLRLPARDGRADDADTDDEIAEVLARRALGRVTCEERLERRHDLGLADAFLVQRVHTRAVRGRAEV